MRRFILTGAPGAGKTSIIRLLEMSGVGVVEEAATDVIAAGQALGQAEPWTDPEFIDQVVSLQRERQLQAAAAPVDVQVHDRSPICTLALSRYVGWPTSPVLEAEVDRITREQLFDHRVFFVRNLGFCEPTAARRISFEESLVFERIHEHTYRRFGYDLVDVAAGPVQDRVSLIRNVILRSTRQAVSLTRTADDRPRPGRSRPEVI
ncbi:MAG TPA: AAA family ATPase [Jiangellaceae bacterium]